MFWQSTRHPESYAHHSYLAVIRCVEVAMECNHGTDSGFAPSQWETALLCNDVSHWLGANMKQPWRIPQEHKYNRQSKEKNVLLPKYKIKYRSTAVYSIDYGHGPSKPCPHSMEYMVSNLYLIWYFGNRVFFYCVVGYRIQISWDKCC